MTRMLHPLDVHAAAKGFPIDAVVRYVEELGNQSTSENSLPWETWFFHDDRDKLEDVCKHVLLDAYHPNEKQHFWNSIGHWRKEALFEKPVLNRIVYAGYSIPEQTWHALVDNHGSVTAILLLEALNEHKRAAMYQGSVEPFLSSVLIEPSPLLALPLRLGMFHDDALSHSHGLNGQSLEFWAKALAKGAGSISWKLFCEMYPWKSPSLVHAILKTEPDFEKYNNFLQDWITAFPNQSQALYTFMLMHDPMGVTDFVVSESFNKDLAKSNMLLLEGLYPSSSEINMYIERYKNLFSSNSGLAIEIALPDSYSI